MVGILPHTASVRVGFIVVEILHAMGTIKRRGSQERLRNTASFPSLHCQHIFVSETARADCGPEAHQRASRIPGLQLVVPL